MAVDASNALLRWYVVDKRQLPWRSAEGETPNPYRVWLSEVMLQQTTVAAVKSYYETFTTRWPDVNALAAADEAEIMAAWAGLGYYARARHLVACARKVAAEHSGLFPDNEATLRTLQGIGRYTAAAIAAIAFGKRAVAVDSNIERVVSRLFAVKDPLPGARDRIYALADSIVPAERSGDFAQAMMDLGSAICTPRRPDCPNCPLNHLCEARLEGRPEAYPVKAEKKKRPRRRGIAYWLEHDGHVLLVRRPAKGLLGGMLGFPTGPWSDVAQPGEGAPAKAEWRDAGSVDHVFTHFALNLRLLCATAERRGEGEGASWWPIARLGEAGLPTLFARVAERGTEWRLDLPSPSHAAALRGIRAAPGSSPRDDAWQRRTPRAGEGL
jgi:A/G-specific adenine glycosylase